MHSWLGISRQNDLDYMMQRATTTPHDKVVKVLGIKKFSMGDEAQPLNVFIGLSSCKFNIKT